MADNFPVTPATSSPMRDVATDQVTYSGDSADVQLIRYVFVTGAEGSKTVIDPPAGAGATTSGTPRTVTASDSPEVTALASVVTNTGDALTRIGEVSSNPTSNTILDRLLQIQVLLGNATTIQSEYFAALPTLTNGQLSPPALDVNSVLYTNPGALSYTTDSVSSYATARTSGGTSISKLITAATTNATVVKASAGQRYRVVCSNLNTSEARYVHFCNSSSTPVAGTTAVVDTIVVPAASSSILPTVMGFSDGIGVAFSTGISYYVTKGVLDSDATALTTANDMVITVEWF